MLNAEKHLEMRLFDNDNNLICDKLRDFFSMKQKQINLNFGESG